MNRWNFPLVRDTTAEQIQPHDDVLVRLWRQFAESLNFSDGVHPEWVETVTWVRIPFLQVCREAEELAIQLDADLWEEAIVTRMWQLRKGTDRLDTGGSKLQVSYDERLEPALIDAQLDLEGQYPADWPVNEERITMSPVLRQQFMERMAYYGFPMRGDPIEFEGGLFIVYRTYCKAGKKKMANALEARRNERRAEASPTVPQGRGLIL